ncbi:MAG: hypothetical protein LBU73_00840 [Helicobacteraceae bacterium]|nr:hypothetical protein [Helicobacteraceae bacterium]
MNFSDYIRFRSENQHPIKIRALLRKNPVPSQFFADRDLCVIGAAFIILFAREKTIANKLLSLKPVVFV